MKLLGSAAVVACVVLSGCSGRYDVGFEPMAGSAGQNSAGSGSVSEGGSKSQAGGSSAIGSAGEEAVDESGKSSRCGFGPEATATVDALVTTDVVVRRIGLFLDGADDVTVGSRPAKPSADFAAALATQVLDEHFMAGTVPKGLVAFLETWLSVPDDQRPFATAESWAAKLAAPDASLTTLLAGATDDPQRIGILTDADVLALRGSITARGLWMNRRLLCNDIPPPPANVPEVPPETGAPKTRRQRLEAAVSDPACQACHSLMDNPGYALEFFDETGTYRELDAGEAVDASGVTAQPRLEFDDYATLAPQLATSCEVALCFSRAVAAHGAPLESPLTEAELKHAANVFADANFSIRALVRAVVSSPAFLR